MKKITVGIVCGGKSSEHQVSLVSGYNIFQAIDKKKYRVLIFAIDNDGNWHGSETADICENAGDIKKIRISKKADKVFIIKDKKGVTIMDVISGKIKDRIDVFFPITHGTFGEDGCLQGFFETLGVAYVGPNVLGSAVGMDKDIMKQILRAENILVAPSITLRKGISKISADAIVEKLGLPLFVKPASLGSSVGVFKCETKKELLVAIKNVFALGQKVLIERAIVGREIECGVLGLEKKIASIPGEIVLESGFYSYDAKYISDSLAVPVPRAKISKQDAKRIQALAIAVCNALECDIMTRVDFFLQNDGQLVVNEVNTLPGFTSISMYPKMFAELGISYQQLLDRLIELALERKKRF